MTENQRKNLIGYACGTGAVIFWGFHMVVIRWLIGQNLNPFLIGDLRLFIGAATLSIVMVFLKLFRKNDTPQIKYSKFFWIITISLAVNFILFHKGLEFTLASDAALLQAFSPVMVLLIVMLFIPKRIEHFLYHTNLTKRILQIVIAGSIGSSLLLINDPKDLIITSESKFIGDIIEFLAMFAWAAVMLGMHEYQKRESKHNILAETIQFLFFAGLIVAPFVPWPQILNVTTPQWGWILLLGVFSTGVTYILWHIASKYLDILPLITLFNFSSIFTVIAESIFLGLGISWELVVGGGLILYAAMHAKYINSKYKILEEKISG